MPAHPSWMHTHTAPMLTRALSIILRAAFKEDLDQVDFKRHGVCASDCLGKCVTSSCTLRSGSWTGGSAAVQAIASHQQD